MADLKTNMKKAAAYYNKGKTRRQRITGLGSNTIDTDDTNFFNTFGPVIREYKQLMRQTGGTVDSDYVDMIRAYNQYANNRKVVINKGGRQDVMKTAEDNSPLVEEGGVKKEQREVSSAQKRGINEIAMWMYRHSKKELIPFISAIMRKTDREKLFIFYLIEKDKRKAYTNKDFRESQSGSYVPSLEKFRDQMVASKVKFWLRIGSHEVYWNKLEDAAQASADMEVLYAAYNIEPSHDVIVEPQDSGDEFVLEGLEPISQEIQNSVDKVDGMKEKDSDLQDLDKTIAKAEADMERLGDKGEVLRIVLDAHRALLAKREAQFKKQYKNQKGDQELAASINTVKQAMKEFIAAKDEIHVNDDLLSLMSAPQHNEVPQSSMSRPGKKGEKKVGEGAATVGQYGGWTKSVFSQFTTLKKIEDWKFPDDWETGLTGAGAGLSGLAGVTSFIAAVTAVIGLCRGGWKANNAMSNVVAVTTIFGKLVSATGDASATASKVMTMMQGSSEAISSANTVAGWGMVASGAIDVGLGVTKLIRAYSTINDMSTSEEAYRKRIQKADKKAKTEARNKGDGSKPDIQRSKDDLREELLFKKMDRENDNSIAEGAIDSLAGGLKIAGGVLMLTGIVAPVGIILGLTGVALSIGKTIAMAVKRRKDRRAAVDDYLNLNFVVNRVKKKLGVNWQRILQPYGIKNEGELKEQLRMELMAKINCASIQSAYMYIMRDYAKMIYRRAFFNKDGKKFTQKDAKKPEFKEASKEFGSILKALKLTPVYPLDDNKEPSPGIPAILAKLVA